MVRRAAPGSEVEGSKPRSSPSNIRFQKHVCTKQIVLYLKLSVDILRKCKICETMLHKKNALELNFKLIKYKYVHV